MVCRTIFLEQNRTLTSGLLELIRNMVSFEDELTSDERTQLKVLLRSLDDKFESSRSFTSSPIFFLISSIVDDLLLLSNILESGGKLFGRRNPTIRFLDSIKTKKGSFEMPYSSNPWPFYYDSGEWMSTLDPLGNSKQISWRPPDLDVVDPGFAAITSDMAYTLAERLRGFVGDSNMKPLDRSSSSSQLPYKGKQETAKFRKKFWLPDHVFYIKKRNREKRRSQ